MQKQHRATEKAYTELNVYEATKARLHFCYANYDDVLINCSGGKDSQVIVLIAKEVLEERGKDEKVKVVFYDQEFIYPQTDEWITNLFKLDWVKGYRLCLSLGMELYQPDGTAFPVTFWDTSRKLFKPIPPDGIFPTKKYADITQAEKAVRDLLYPNNGSIRIAQLIGVRAQESVTRLSTILASYKKGAQCFLRHSPHARGTDIGTPIYDWSEKDVWYYLKQHQDVLPINDMYYIEMISGRPLRVGLPINPNTVTSIEEIKKKSPVFFNMLTEIFPQINTTARYAKSLKQFNNYNQMIEKYGLSIRGIKKLIEDTVPEGDGRLFALIKLKKFVTDYMEFDRYKKFGHTYESALRIAFITFCKNNYSRNIMLRNKVETKKERLAREALEVKI